MITLVGLLTSVRRTNMNLQATLLRKALRTVLTLVLRIVRILVIDDQTLLADINLLRTPRHAAAPLVLNDRVRKDSGQHIGY